MIYAIWFPEANDQSVYVGQTRRRAGKRFREHVLNSQNPRQKRTILYNWMKARIGSGLEPELVTLEEIASDQVSDREIAWQVYFKDLGWNCKHQKGGDVQFGYVPTVEHRQRMSEAAKRRIRTPMSEETKAKIGAANRGLVRSPEIVEAMREASTGRKQSPETIAKRMEKLNDPGLKAERVARATESRRGYRHSPETIEKIRNSNTGFKHSNETRQRMSEQRRGRPWSQQRRSTHELRS